MSNILKILGASSVLAFKMHQSEGILFLCQLTVTADPGGGELFQSLFI